MRIAGCDDGLHAKRLVFPQAFGNGFRTADQGGANTVAHQADAGPQVGADFQLVTPAAVQVQLTQLADGIGVGAQALLGEGDSFVGQMTDQAIGGVPGFLIRLADDQVDAQAVGQGAAPRGGAGSDRVQLLLYRAGGSPQVR